MITSTKYRPGLYDALFEKANKQLNYVEGSDDYITSLEKYFSHLQNLVYGNKIEFDATDPSNYSKLIYLKLPLDEPPIWIDANTRTISRKIEESGYGQWGDGKFIEYKKGSAHPFFTNGIAVQGDEVAEIIFFEIDRFFDAMDLDLTKIAVQWIHEDDLKTRTPVYNYTPIVIKDIESVPGKLIFGWPVGSAITQKPGKIHFSVRFYQTAGDDIIYSLSTQTAIAVVNPTILSNVEDLNATVDNYISLITGRLENSIFGGYAKASYPKYLILGPEGYQIDDINNIKDEDKLYLLAYSENGLISYEWQLIPYGETAVVALSDLNKLNESNSEYIEISEWNEKILTYYEQVSSGKYSGMTITSEKDFNDYINSDENNVKKLYVKYAVLKLKDVIDKLKAGKIHVYLHNNYYSNEQSVDINDYNNNYWEIPAPNKPFVNIANEGNTVRLGDYVELITNLIDSNYSVYWYCNDEMIELDDDQNASNFTIPNKEGYYQVEIINRKNNTDVSSGKTDKIFAYEPLDASKLNDFNVEDYQIVRADNGNVKIQVDKIKELYPGQYDQITYSWVIQTVGLDEDIVTEDTIKDGEREILVTENNYIILNKPYDDMVNNSSTMVLVALNVKVDKVCFDDKNNPADSIKSDIEQPITKIIYF